MANEARGVALGQTLVAFVDDASALRWNPAGLAKVANREFQATHVQYFQDLHGEHVAYAHPLGNAALGGEAFFLTTPKIEAYDINGARNGSFEFYNAYAAIGYGRQVIAREEGTEVLLGFALKGVDEFIDGDHFRNLAADGGVMVSPRDRLNFGAAVRNLSGSKADFPVEIQGGAAVDILRGFTAAAAVHYAQDAKIRESVGLEYKVPDIGGTLRAGYKTRDELNDAEEGGIKGLRDGGFGGLSFGAGFEYTPPQYTRLRFGLDYAMAPFGALGVAHYITIKTKW